MAKKEEPKYYNSVEWQVNYLTKLIGKELTCYGRHSVHNVFEDLMDIIAIAVNNKLGVYSQALEDRYMKEYVPRYGRDWLFQATDAATEIMAFFAGGGRDDLLGRVFHALELHNKYRGQFFTPYPVSYMMARMNFEGVNRVIARNGFVSILEPTCGAGGMIIASAAVIETGFNLQEQCVMVAQDIDRKAVRMTYIQASACGIPCMVRMGNSLSNEFSETWFTPAFVHNKGMEKLFGKHGKKQRVRTL